MLRIELCVENGGVNIFADSRLLSAVLATANCFVIELEAICVVVINGGGGGLLFRRDLVVVPMPTNVVFLLERPTNGVLELVVTDELNFEDREEEVAKLMLVF